MIAGVGGMERRYHWGVWNGHGHTAMFKMHSQQGPPVQHMELCSMFVATWMGGKFGGEQIQYENQEE